jgi:division protein CdvB (Snf7/Vps24/ESCRT-III family)
MQVIWTSPLQPDIVMSTMESKYNTMSMAMRDVIPLEKLTKNIIQGLGSDDMNKTHINTMVHKDNHGLLHLP